MRTIAFADAARNDLSVVGGMGEHSSDFGSRGDRSHHFAHGRHSGLAIAGSNPLHATHSRACGGNDNNREDGMKHYSGTYTLYSMQWSGNCYKVRLALAQLGISYRLVELHIVNGETRTPAVFTTNHPAPLRRLQPAPVS